MVRRSVCLLIVLMFAAVSAEHASAKEHDWWGWLEQFSGPGPFSGKKRGAIGALNACWTKVEKGPKILGGPDDFDLRGGTPQENAFCLWGDLKFLAAPVDIDRDFKRIDASLFDWGMSVSIQRAVTLGAGVGLIRFAPEGEDAKRRFVVTPIRLTINPSLALAPIAWRPTNRLLKGAFYTPQLYLKLVCVPGELTGADFGDPTHLYKSRKNECVDSWGVQFNLLELYELFRN